MAVVLSSSLSLHCARGPTTLRHAVSTALQQLRAFSSTHRLLGPLSICINAASQLTHARLWKPRLPQGCCIADQRECTRWHGMLPAPGGLIQRIAESQRSMTLSSIAGTISHRTSCDGHPPPFAAPTSAGVSVEVVVPTGHIRLVWQHVAALVGQELRVLLKLAQVWVLTEVLSSQIAFLIRRWA